MVPDIAGTGHSFKGAFAYYLHDKRQDEASPHPETAGRVAWTETRNLLTDDPALAQRAMIATALSADRLKEEAGISARGRKSSAHVYAYSLAWHPDEAGQLDRAEMVRAADASLKALGAEDRQAVIVAHTDRAHPHVHVIVNRVDPSTGKMLTTSNDRLKLSDWANAYERERGAILTPTREEKRQLREQFADKAERQQYAKGQWEAHTGAKTDGRDKNPVATLKALGAAQRAQHRQEWRDLSAENKTARERIYGEAGSAIRDAAARHKAECRPIWAQHYREARDQVRAFETREQTLAGVIRNAMDTTAHQKISGQLENRGVLAATFGNVLSSQARAAALRERQEMSRGQLATRLKSILDDEIAQLKEQRTAALTKQRQVFERDRASLIERQDLERAKIREAWRALPRDRGGDRQPDRSKPYRKRWQEATSAQEQKPMKRPFDEARRREPRKVDPAPTQAKFISQAQPAPSPSGDAPKPAPKRLQQVPEKTPAMPAGKRLASAKKDWTPAAAKPAPSPKKDWSAKAPEQARTLKRLPQKPDRDREPER